MKFNTRDIDMLRGSLWDKIILFALPLALTGVLQQLLNSADVFTLGKFVGKNAMAAVGNNISMVGLILSLMIGLSLGANVVIAQNIGAKKIDRAHSAVSTAFVLAMAAGTFFCALGELLVAPVFYFLDVPESVVGMAETYLRIFLLSLPAISDKSLQFSSGDFPQQRRHAHTAHCFGDCQRREHFAEPFVRLAV